jgi:RNA polymerase sigma factor (sigma-70 family)
MYKRSLKDGPEVVSEIKEGSYPVVERRRPLSLDDEICDDGTLKDMLEFRPEAREYDSRVLDRLLDSLTDSQRDCVVLHYIHGITQADIARRLGISHQGVRQKLGRAMKTLKERACVGI